MVNIVIQNSSFSSQRSGSRKSRPQSAKLRSRPTEIDETLFARKKPEDLDPKKT